MSTTVSDFKANITADSKKAVAEFDKWGKAVGKNTSSAGSSFKSFAKIAAGAVAAGFAVDKIKDFAVESVKRFSEAEEYQKKLSFAFSKFPKLADTNQKALQKLNTELQKKTKFDDDEIAGGQAVLAQFKLTGKELEEVTPLLVDYADKTGKDVPTAAGDLGKALLGNAKALKNIGISYKATGDSTTDFNNITALLRKQVGGFAEEEGTTAAGKLEILQNRFGDVQEKVGGALMPVLDNFLDWLNGDGLQSIQDFVDKGVIPAIHGFEDFIKWGGEIVENTPAWLQQLALLAGAFVVLDIVLDLNPIGAFTLALEGLIAVAALVGTHINEIESIVTRVNGGVASFVLGTMKAVAGGLEFLVNSMIDGLNSVIVVVNMVGGVFGLPHLATAKHVDYTSGISKMMAASSSLFKGVQGYFDSGGLGKISVADYAKQNSPSNPGAAGTHGTTERSHLAAGGVTYGPMAAWIGDNPGGREVVEPLASYKAELARERDAAAVATAQRVAPAGGGSTFEIHVSDPALLSLFDVYERRADGRRVLVSKMGKQK